MNDNPIAEDLKNITDPVLRRKAKAKAWREANKVKKQETQKIYREKNKEKIRQQQKDWYDKNKVRVKALQINHYYSNKDKISAKKKEYYNSNKHKVEVKVKVYRDKNILKERERAKKYYYNNKNKKLLYNKIYCKNRYKKDVAFKLRKNLRSRLRTMIDKNQKTGNAVRDLGCSIPEFKIYLESKFQQGMSWDNHGVYGWHIDHIKPLASFDLTDRNQLLQACHYTNLQPLWAKDNIVKSDKII